jgi:thiamine pyrophosphokinase
LISPDGRARIRLHGTRWSLDDELLPLGTRGVSNEALGEEVSVRVEGGRVVVCHESVA